MSRELLFAVLAQLPARAPEPVCMHARIPRAALRRHSLRSCLLACFAACSAPTAPQFTGADVGFELQACDARGVPQALDALPRRPEFVLSSEKPLAAAELLLFSGVPDAELQGDLGGLPLRAASVARRIAGRARADPAVLRFVPEAPLARGESYSVALTGDVRVRGGSEVNADGPGFLAQVRVADEPAAGAAWLATAPAAGASGVPPNLGAVLLALDGEASGLARSVWLQGPDGHAVATELHDEPCAAIEARAATCAALVLRAPLRAASGYTIRSNGGVFDAHGAPLAPLHASFETAELPDRGPPRFAPLGCLRDELALAEPPGCVLPGARSLQLRLRADEPSRAVLRSGQRQSAALANDGVLELELHDLAADAELQLVLEVFDLAGNTSAATLALRTTPELATLAIVEIRADPAGPEPAQEYVELLNFGGRPVQLGGVSLVDARDDGAIAIDRDLELPAGARALLVAGAFDPVDPRDEAPPPGTRLIRIGPSLTRSGLANSGEPLLLRDEAQHRLSAAPALEARGQCLQRRGTDPRSGKPANFALAPCTPGL